MIHYRRSRDVLMQMDEALDLMTKAVESLRSVVVDLREDNETLLLEQEQDDTPHSG